MKINFRRAEQKIRSYKLKIAKKIVELEELEVGKNFINEEINNWQALILGEKNKVLQMEKTLEVRALKKRIARSKSK